MQNKEENIKQNILSVFNNDFPLISQNGQKAKAIEFYKKNNFPGLKDEGWRQTNLSPLFKTDYHELMLPDVKIELEKYIIPGLDSDILVFVNGFYNSGLSRTENNAIKVTDIKSATEKYTNHFRKYFESTEVFAENNFTAINTAFAHHGSFIYIEKNKTQNKPVQIININTGNMPVMAQIRNLIVVEKSAEIKIIESFHTDGELNSLTNVVTEVILEENAGIDWVRFQKESNESNQINHMRVVQKRDSKFKSNTISLSGKLIRNSIQVELSGDGGNCNLYGLYVPKGEQLFDNYTYINHATPHCESDQVYKGIIDEDASAVFYGKVLVSKDAQKTNANQSNKNVLLSENAKINSKPQLEIYADDVACSHGSTTGQLDREAMFYLQSRGIPSKKAQIMLLHGFVSEVINQISIDEVKEYIDDKVNQILEQKNTK